MSIARTLAIAAATAGVALGGLAIAPTAGAAPTATVVINCVGKGVVKPKQIIIACADAGVMVYKISWTSWTDNEAKGTGTLAWNTCLPKTCVAGIVQKYKVKITLGRVASGPNVTVFSGMTLNFGKDGGPAAAKTSTYILDNKIA